ncbi:MAG: hypothetical protein NW201_11540 [Gemmatimonadales bacterium]|nr:hypothetical protein [Gemmatimonadales bacterium]
MSTGAPARIEADLRIEGPLGSLHVGDRAGELVVSLPPHLSFDGARRMPRGAIAVLAATLRRLDVQVVVETGDRPIARLGAGTHPGLVSQLLGVGDTELRLGQLLRAFLGA